MYEIPYKNCLEYCNQMISWIEEEKLTEDELRIAHRNILEVVKYMLYVHIVPQTVEDKPFWYKRYQKVAEDLLPNHMRLHFNTDYGYVEICHVIPEYEDGTIVGYRWDQHWDIQDNTHIYIAENNIQKDGVTIHDSWKEYKDLCHYWFCLDPNRKIDRPPLMSKKEIKCLASQADEIEQQILSLTDQLQMAYDGFLDDYGKLVKKYDMFMPRTMWRERRNKYLKSNIIW